MIVCRDDHQRDFFHCGDVHSFVERPGLHPAFADAGKTDEVFFAFKSLGHQGAHRDRNHRAEVADHCELVLARVTSMNIAVASAHWAEA